MRTLFITTLAFLALATYANAQYPQHARHYFAPLPNPLTFDIVDMYEPAHEPRDPAMHWRAGK